jgi:hypothetical protein
MTPPSVLFLAAALLTQQAQGGPSPASGPSPTPAAVAADTGSLRHTHGRTPPLARAARITGAAPRVDGRLDDAAWDLVEPVTEFTQFNPRPGEPASERTEVRIVYDHEAIYVGARLLDGDPAGVRSQLSRRDDFSNSDAFGVAFDSYHDHRTSFSFNVNPSGVKSDAIIGNDGNSFDEGWDPVWDVATSRDSLGWSVEMRIPFSQLRYPPRASHVWGLNLSRFIQRKAEDAAFAWRPVTERGHASFFGHLFGLEGLPQPRRLELLPYATARQERIEPVVAPGAPPDPFNDGSVGHAALGLDVKYGLTSNLTLDATINPDFGQVEADPAVVNLSAFESFFDERRPFFIEGADIFRSGGQQYFYSRRIGRQPQGFTPYRGPGAYTETPDNATIVGAAKLSGRTGGGWSIGLLEAVTAREFATVDSAGTRFRDEVEPLTNYAVLRAKRDYRGGASTLGFIFTSVLRDLDEPRLSFLRRAAWAGGLDFSSRFMRNRYSISGSFGFSNIRGDTLAIQRAQRSSARYNQRPDADYVDYRPYRHQLSGWTGSLSGGKVSGDWLFNLSANATSPGFEVNDLGFQTSADDAQVNGNIRRVWTRPGKVFRFANLSVNGSSTWNFGGVRTGSRLGMNWFAQFLNYYSFNGNLNRNFSALSDNLTRGGPLGYSPSQWNGFLGFSTDFRKPWQVFIGAFYSRNELGGYGTGPFVDLSVRPTTTLSLSVGPEFNTSRSIMQFVRSDSDLTAVPTFGRRYVFADLRQQTVNLNVRMNVTFSPTLSLQLFTQAFDATADYLTFKELVAPRRRDFIVYGSTPGSSLVPHCFDDSVEVPCGAGAPPPSYYEVDPDGPAGPRPPTTVRNDDFSFRSLRGNLVLRWEYRPGSTLFAVWTTSCSASSRSPRLDFPGDFGHLCRGSGENVFALKANYWLSF